MVGQVLMIMFSATMLPPKMAATGVDLVTAFGTTAACLNNMGVGLGDRRSGLACRFADRLMRGHAGRATGNFAVLCCCCQISGNKVKGDG